MISITQAAALFLAACVGISSIGAAAVYIFKAIGWIRKPEQDQNAKLADHETRIRELERKASNDFEDIRDIREEMRLMLAATLATIKHQIDGNDVEALRKVQSDLNDYLIKK